MKIFGSIRVFGFVFVLTGSFLVGIAAVSAPGNHQALKTDAVVLLEEDFEDALTPEWDLDDQTPPFSGWTLATGPDAFEGQGYVEIVGFEPDFDGCAAKTKSLRSPLFSIAGLHSVAFAFYYRAFPFEGLKRDHSGVSAFLVPSDQFGKVSGHRIALANLKVETRQDEWMLAYLEVEANQFPTEDIFFELQYNSSDTVCDTYQMDNLLITGVVPPDFEVETIIVQPNDIGGTHVLQFDETISFEAALATEPVGNVSFTWEVVDALSGTLLYSLNGQNVSVRFDIPGSYLVRCFATVAGIIDTTPASLQFLVVENKNLDTVILEPAEERVEAIQGEILRFRAIAFGGNAATEFVWTVTDSSANPESQTFTGVVPDIDFPGQGTYQVLCSARDEVGYLDPSPAMRIVEIRGQHVRIVPPAPLPPSGNLIVSTGEPVTFQGQMVDLDGSFSSAYWLLNPGEQLLCNNQVTCPITFTDPGEYSVSFIAPLPDAEPASDFLRVLVDPPLVVSILQPVQDGEIQVNEPITFEGAVTGTLAENAEVFWVFGSQTFAGLEFTLEGIAEPGYYQAKLVATHSGQGIAESRIVDFLVYDSERPAMPRILSPKTDFLMPPGDDLLFESSFGGLPRAEQNPFWEIRNIEDGSLLESGISETLGRVNFPEEGVFVASLFNRSSQGNRLAERRTITVRRIDPSEFGENTSLENAAPLSFGNYDELNFERANFFSVILPENGFNLQLELRNDGPFELILFDAEDNQIAQRAAGVGRAFQFFGLSPGSYKIAFIPGGNSKNGGSAGFSVAVPDSILFFPDINGVDGFQTSIGIVNPTNGFCANIHIYGYNALGALKGMKMANIKPHGSFKGNVFQLFGPMASQITWIRVVSAIVLVGYAHTSRGLEAYAVSGAKQLEPELFVPHIAQETGLWFTRGNVVNGATKTVKPFMEAFDSQMPQGPPSSSGLDNKNGYTRDSFDLFTEIKNNKSGWGKILEQDNDKVLAGTEVFHTEDATYRRVGLGLGGLPRHTANFTSGKDSLYFAHIANENNFWTGIAFVNVEDSHRIAEIIAYNETGTRLGSKIINLDPYEKRVGLAQELLKCEPPDCDPIHCIFPDFSSNNCIRDPGTAAWLEVIGTGDLVGYELFGSVARDPNKQMAGLESIIKARNRLCFPYLEPNQNMYHAFALVNVHPMNTADVNVRVFDADGNCAKDSNSQWLEKPMRLGPKTKTIFLISTLFPVLPNTASWVEVDSNQDLVGFELFGNTTMEQMSGIIADGLESTAN